MTTTIDTPDDVTDAGEPEIYAPTPAKRAPFPVYLTVFVITVIWMIPTVGLLVNSFRDPSDIRESGWWTALASPFDTAQWTLDNYTRVLDEGFSNAFLNTFAVAIPSTVIPIMIAAFAAYAFAWMDFPGRNFLFVVVVGLMVVPLQMALIPILRVYTNVDLTGTYPAVWLAHAGFGLPLAVYLLRNYMGSLPGSMIESAAHRRCRPLRDLHPADPAAVGPGVGVVCDLPVPLDVERLPRCTRVPRHRSGQARAHRRTRRSCRAR